MENVARHPDARPEDVEEARERLAALIGNVRMFPDNGLLVAESGCTASWRSANRVSECRPGMPTSL